MFRFGQKGISKIAVLAVLFVITACSGGGGGGGGPITVSGIVVDSSNTVVSGASVILNNETASLVTTGADGAFSFANVTPPYILTMMSGTTLVEYRDLSRSNPQLSISGTGAAYTTILGGKITGPVYPLSGQGILIGTTNGVLAESAVSAGTGTYIAGLLWSGSQTKTTDLAALHFSYTGNLITSYHQTGTLTGVSLNSGVTQTGLDIALSSPMTSASTTFNYSPGAYTTDTSGGCLMVKANGGQFILAGPSIPSGTSVLFPSDGGTFLVRGKDLDGNSISRVGAAVLGGATTIDLPGTVMKNSDPTNHAVNISKTPTLSWTPVSGAEFYLVTITGAALKYTLYLPGASATLTIPDYTALGLPLAGSTVYSWKVEAFAASGMSVNFITDPATSAPLTLMMYQASSLNYYKSQNTVFTTEP